MYDKQYIDVANLEFHGKVEFYTDDFNEIPEKTMF